MKKINALMLAGFLVMATHGLALAEDKVKVLQCPMDQYTVPKDCPLCGMKLEEKEMTAADAQAATDKAKDKMRNRS